MEMLLQGIGTILAVLLVAVAAWATANFSKWTGVQLTDQQRNIINEAAEMIAGALKVLITQRTLQAGHLHSANKDVVHVATKFMTADVMDAMKDRGVTPTDLIDRAIAIVGHDHPVLMHAEEQKPILRPIDAP